MNGYVSAVTETLRILALGDVAHESAEQHADSRTSLVIGNFDGVHRGHAAVIDHAVADAASANLVPAVLTFDPHPASVLGRSAPARLTTLATRALLLEKRGIERLYIRTFDRDLASWSPERFAEELLVKSLHVGEVIVGDNFRFGHKRAGDLQTLIALGKSLGFAARAHAIAGDASGAFSSTRARGALERGDIAEAEHVLGRSHAFTGVVVHGDARGRTIGFPTANLAQMAELVPSNGVYAVRVSEVEGDGNDLAREIVAQRAAVPVASGFGVMNIGTRPTVTGSGSERRIEVHVLGRAAGDAAPSVDLYDRRLRVEVVARIRDERRFDGLDALKAQIARDCDGARACIQSVQ